jgi:hypothetical protein
MSDQKMMRLVGAVERTTGDGEKKTWWTDIGLAFLNRDGSYTLRFDYIPTRIHETTIQLRPFPAKEAKEEAEASQ